MNRPIVLFLFLGVIVLPPMGWGLVLGEGKSQEQSNGELTAQEIRLAREVAERELPIEQRPSSPARRTCFIKVDLLPDAQAESTQRLVMVHHYRYEGDETVLSMVDLNRLEVVKREVASHFPTALSPAELARAVELARADSRISALVVGGGARWECRPMHVSSDHAQFGRRLVLVALHHQDNDQALSLVCVDLHTETVHIVN